MKAQGRPKGGGGFFVHPTSLWLPGALSSSLEAVAFKSELTDRYLTANQAMGKGRFQRIYESRPYMTRTYQSPNLKKEFKRRELFVDRIFFWSWKMSFWNSSFPRFFLDNFGVSYRWRPFFWAQGGGMDGSEESFVPEALFYMKDGPVSVFCFVAAIFGSPYHPSQFVHFPIHLPQKSTLNVGEYASPMDGMGRCFFPEKKHVHAKKTLVLPANFRG